MKKIIQNYTLEELREAALEIGMPQYRAEQMFGWIYKKCIISFDDMKNVSKEHRALVSDNFQIGNFESKTFRSKDGTIKFLHELDDGNKIESVLIPMKNRHTLCVSTQAGCPLDCKFCMTGKHGFKRNLRPWEIVEQILSVIRIYGDDKKISNLVFMGMGESLLNVDNVAKAVKILQEEKGLRFTKRSITISTAGVTPKIKELREKCEVMLAVSLNASNDAMRSKIMPINKKYPMDKLIKALRRYPLKDRERITFEYVMLKGVNDAQEHAIELSKAIKGMKCKVNLIPFNEDKRLPYKRPTDATVDKFFRTLNSNGVTSTVRKSKGLDIKAACGQLVGA